MKFKENDSVINIKPVESIKILTTLKILYAGDLEFYPFSNFIGKGYHMTYYSWDEMCLDPPTLLFRDFFIKEDELDDRFILYYELTKNHEMAIERDKRISEIFED